MTTESSNNAATLFIVKFRDIVHCEIP